MISNISTFALRRFGWSWSWGEHSNLRVGNWLALTLTQQKILNSKSISILHRQTPLSAGEKFLIVIILILDRHIHILNWSKILNILNNSNSKLAASHSQRLNFGISTIKAQIIDNDAFSLFYREWIYNLRAFCVKFLALKIWWCIFLTDFMSCLLKSQCF